jgi:hypothetical protein
MADRVSRHRTSDLNKILMSRVNCKPTGRFLMILSVKFSLNLCSRLCFFEPKHTTSTLYAFESSYLDFNCGSTCSGGIGYYSTTCIRLAMFCYIMTVQNVVYVLCINFISFQNCKDLFETPSATLLLNLL